MGWLLWIPSAIAPEWYFQTAMCALSLGGFLNVIVYALQSRSGVKLLRQGQNVDASAGAVALNSFSYNVGIGFPEVREISIDEVFLSAFSEIGDETESQSLGWDNG